MTAAWAAVATAAALLVGPPAPVPGTGPALVQAGQAARRTGSAERRSRRPSIRLALLVPTAEAEADRIGQRALTALAATVARRTSVEVDSARIAILRPLEPELFEHPLVFLSGEADFAAWSQAELDAMRTYLSLGGMVVVNDRTGRRGSPFGARAREQLSRAVGGRTFETLSSDHSILRSYYLLDRSWGRVDVQADLEALVLDGRAAVVLSANDLLGALARDEFGHWSLPVEPGGRRQRERALRLGVNLVLYALTLDYKEDLVHLPHILERRR